MSGLTASEPGLLASLRTVPGHTFRVFFICLVGVTFVLTEISRTFGWTDLDRGLYIALTFVVAGLLITQIGTLADRIGRKPVLLGATLLTPAFVAVLTWAPNTAVLLIARTLGFTTAGVQSPVTGTLALEESPPRLPPPSIRELFRPDYRRKTVLLFLGIFLYVFAYGAYAVIFTFIAENFPAKLRATAASFASSFAVGLGLGPFALSYAIGQAGWESAFTLCAVLAVLLAGGLFLMLPPVPREAVV